MDVHQFNEQCRNIEKDLTQLAKSCTEEQLATLFITMALNGLVAIPIDACKNIPKPICAARYIPTQAVAPRVRHYIPTPNYYIVPADQIDSVELVLPVPEPRK